MGNPILGSPWPHNPRGTPGLRRRHACDGAHIRCSRPAPCQRATLHCGVLGPVQNRLNTLSGRARIRFHEAMHNVIPLFSPYIDRGRQVLVCAPGDRTSGLFPFFDDLREWRSQSHAFAADPRDVRNQTVRHDAFAQGDRFQVIPCFVRRFDPLPRRRVTVALILFFISSAPLLRVSC